MSQPESVSQLNGKPSCPFCLEHGIIETLLGHICKFNNNELKETPHEAGNTSNTYRIIEQKPRKAQKIKNGKIFIGFASIYATGLILAPNDFQHQHQLRTLNVEEGCQQDTLYTIKIEKTIGTRLNNSIFTEYNKHFENRKIIFTFPFGYPIIKFNEEHKKQIVDYLNSHGSNDLKNIYEIIEFGMLKISCINIKTANKIREIIKTLSFRLNNGSVKHPIIISFFQTLSLILMSCDVDINVSWKQYRNAIASENDCKPPLWEHYMTVDVDDEKKRIYFYVDPITRSNILKNENLMKFNNVPTEVKERFNIFKPDMKEFVKIDSTLFTYRFYIEIKNEQFIMPRCQLEHIKMLSFDNLPYDFDGGKILKYIIEEMNLEEFYYGNITLILNGQKQEVEKFEANEIQITSILEMFRQFPTISSFCLKLSETVIASDEIERVINPPTDLFENLKEFEVIDNSKYRGLLGVFLGLFKNFRNLKKISLKTQDRYINTLLEEFLPHMSQLNEIYLTSTKPRGDERLKIINMFVPNLSKLSIAADFIDDAKNIFGSDVEICKVTDDSQMSVQNDPIMILGNSSS